MFLFCFLLTFPNHQERSHVSDLSKIQLSERTGLLEGKLRCFCLRNHISIGNKFLFLLELKGSPRSKGYLLPTQCESRMWEPSKRHSLLDNKYCVGYIYILEEHYNFVQHIFIEFPTESLCSSQEEVSYTYSLLRYQ